MLLLGLLVGSIIVNYSAQPSVHLLVCPCTSKFFALNQIKFLTSQLLSTFSHHKSISSLMVPISHTLPFACSQSPFTCSQYPSLFSLLVLSLPLPVLNILPFSLCLFSVSLYLFSISFPFLFTCSLSHFIIILLFLSFLPFFSLCLSSVSFFSSLFVSPQSLFFFLSFLFLSFLPFSLSFSSVSFPSSHFACFQSLSFLLSFFLPFPLSFSSVSFPSSHFACFQSLSFLLSLLVLSLFSFFSLFLSAVSFLILVTFLYPPLYSLLLRNLPFLSLHIPFLHHLLSLSTSSYYQSLLCHLFFS
ncbi:unnamed protein product [Acanthosepion pharaonis]|uniref:Uncharacterized protein n=1 Tax=Acanthosepion pharaonis TaxID=158019 RepID=A0A812BT78_ACAPH|nr:unnamed protein product [Sepia pharaonis]